MMSLEIFWEQNLMPFLKLHISLELCCPFQLRFIKIICELRCLSRFSSNKIWSPSEKFIDKIWCPLIFYCLNCVVTFRHVLFKFFCELWCLFSSSDHKIWCTSRNFIYTIWCTLTFHWQNCVALLYIWLRIFAVLEKYSGSIRWGYRLNNWHNCMKVFSK